MNRSVTWSGNLVWQQCGHTSWPIRTAHDVKPRAQSWTRSRCSLKGLRASSPRRHRVATLQDLLQVPPAQPQQTDDVEAWEVLRQPGLAVATDTCRLAHSRCLCYFLLAASRSQPKVDSRISFVVADPEKSFIAKRRSSSQLYGCQLH